MHYAVSIADQAPLAGTVQYLEDRGMQYAGSTADAMPYAAIAAGSEMQNDGNTNFVERVETNSIYSQVCVRVRVLVRASLNDPAHFTPNKELTSL